MLYIISNKKKLCNTFEMDNHLLSTATFDPHGRRARRDALCSELTHACKQGWPTEHEARVRVYS